MQRHGTNPHVPEDARFAAIWHTERQYLLAMASRMLGDPAEADDVLQDAFGSLARLDPDEVVDARGWLIVAVRRRCLDRIRSARARHESAAGDRLTAIGRPAHGGPAADPADRVTLDDELQLALAVVLDRLSPAERTAFVLHDVFGFPFDAVGEIVGRTTGACRQLASRARRTIRSDAPEVRRRPVDLRRRLVTERFIAACSGGDIDALMALLDPDVAGEATMLGRGPLVRVEGRADVARRIIDLFASGAGMVLTPLDLDGHAGVLAVARNGTSAVLRLEETDGLIHHIHSFVRRPTRAAGAGGS
ncbi:MAG: polymerase subunit sigma [Ilumatobacteraceae bacterium]|nr:polymerase subunit sigma [Ilumatobacteraceae bacterium]